MFVNCSDFCDVRHVRSSVLGQNVMFGSVRSSVLLLCDQSSLGTYSLMFANCSVFCDVRHVRSSILGQNVMFRKFDVWTFNVQSVRSSVFWCSFKAIFYYLKSWPHDQDPKSYFPIKDGWQLLIHGIWIVLWLKI